MKNDLELAVAQAAMNIRLMERALYESRANWEMRWAGHTAQISRHVDWDKVTLSADFPDQCLIAPADWVEILVDGEIVAGKQIPHPGDGPMTIAFTLVPARRISA